MGGSSSSFGMNYGETKRFDFFLGEPKMLSSIVRTAPTKEDGPRLEAIKVKGNSANCLYGDNSFGSTVVLERLKYEAVTSSDYRFKVYLVKDNIPPDAKPVGEVTIEVRGKRISLSNPTAKVKDIFVSSTDGNIKELSVDVGYNVKLVFNLTFLRKESGAGPLAYYFNIISSAEGTIPYKPDFRSIGRSRIGSPSDAKCQRIKLFMVTDPLSGSNLSQAIMRVTRDEGYTEWCKRPCLTSVTKPQACSTLAWKTLYLGADMGLLLEYSGLRYFLWFLVSGKWCVRILLQRNTQKFFRALDSSAYAYWGPYLRQQKFDGYPGYFLY